MIFEKKMPALALIYYARKNSPKDDPGNAVYILSHFQNLFGLC